MHPTSLAVTPAAYAPVAPPFTLAGCTRCVGLREGTRDEELNYRMTIRELQRDEVELVWLIDRSEVIERVYYHEHGGLVLKQEKYDVPGWQRETIDEYQPWLLDCFDRGGAFFGAFEDDRLIGISVLETRFIGRAQDQLQLKFLHVGRARRQTGLGRTLFNLAVSRARELGARRLYVSSTPSENTVEFYLHLGCRVTEDVDRELFRAEPEDIHLEYDIPQ
jgi:predicted N-acetyltransferase YhbS